MDDMQKQPNFNARLLDIPNCALRLPCSVDQLKDFITQLLRQPETVTKSIFGKFEIGRDEIEQLFHVVSQRITQQNDASLVQFTTQIQYADHSTILLDGLQAFLSYNEIRPVASVGVLLRWTWLVQFQDRPLPERQVIEVAIGGNKPNFIRANSSEAISAGKMFIQRNSMRFKIDHTARTWGADIEGLLTAQLTNFLKNPNPVKAFIKKYHGWIGFGVGVLIFVVALIVVYWTMNSFMHSHLETVKGLNATSEKGDTITAKLDYTRRGP